MLIIIVFIYLLGPTAEVDNGESIEDDATEDGVAPAPEGTVFSECL